MYWLTEISYTKAQGLQINDQYGKPPIVKFWHFDIADNDQFAQAPQHTHNIPL